MKDWQVRDQDWTGWIQRIAAGDQAALSALYDASSRLLYGLILRITSDPSTAEEVLLDAFTQVWRQAAAFDRERGTPLAWMLTIARTRALDRIRAGRLEHLRREPLDAADNAVSNTASPEQTTIDDERRRLVRGALAQLAEEQRVVLDLAYFSGLSHSEIALRTGIPLGTVKTRIRLGMNKLREELRPLLDNR